MASEQGAPTPYDRLCKIADRYDRSTAERSWDQLIDTVEKALHEAEAAAMLWEQRHGVLQMRLEAYEPAWTPKKHA